MKGTPRPASRIIPLHIAQQYCHRHGLQAAPLQGPLDGRGRGLHGPQGGLSGGTPSRPGFLRTSPEEDMGPRPFNGIFATRSLRACLEHPRWNGGGGPQFPFHPPSLPSGHHHPSPTPLSERASGFLPSAHVFSICVRSQQLAPAWQPAPRLSDYPISPARPSFLQAISARRPLPLPPRLLLPQRARGWVRPAQGLGTTLAGRWHPICFITYRRKLTRRPQSHTTPPPQQRTRTQVSDLRA